MIRRQFLARIAALAAAWPISVSARQLAPVGEGAAFSADTLREIAKALASKDYAERPQIPDEWINLSYDDFAHIWFAERNALWNNTEAALRVDAFSAGLYSRRSVQIHAVENGVARPVPYDRTAFDTTDNFPDLPITEAMGYSGYRLRAEIEKPGIFTEFMVAQGASYFRAIGTGQIYGQSARGLAIDTAEPTGEEFPDFIAHWIERPKAGERQFSVHALLDSPSVSGAYSFKVRPGLPLEMDVECHLFPRREVTHVGIAPLTSMFLFDDTNRNRFDDFRPAVHDTDGLLMWNGADEMLWRPLANPKELQVSSFADTDPKGFGLLQRTRGFEDFADMVALYHRRPSVWVEPGEAWGKGAVSLVEIPTPTEVHDNIVVYWRPESPLAAGGEYGLTYRLFWGGEPNLSKPHLTVQNTRIGAALTKGRVVTIDYAAHEDQSESLEDYSVSISLSAGTVLGAPVVQFNPQTKGPRIAFSFEPGDAELIEFRVSLALANGLIGETWVYRWTA